MAGPLAGIDRLARRFAAGSLIVSLSVADTKQRRLGSESIDLAVNVLDLSVMGAQLEGPALGHIVPGMLVDVSIGSHRGAAEVRHCRPGGSPGRALYGVQFLDQGDLRDAVNGIVDALQASQTGDDTLWAR